MASAGSPSPSFLTCMICTETYQDPCTLNCHHTFCRKCILTYLQSCPRPSSIQCPSCKHHTKVQDSTLPLSQWVGQLTPNPIVVKLINQDTEDLKTCFLCNAKGTSVVSKFWCHICDIAMCDTCHQTHCLIPITRDHEVSELSQEFKVTRKRKVYCQEHPKNEIELCCKICDKPICQMCCILYHRKCDLVVTMESLKPEMQTKLNQMVDEISRKIDKMYKNVNQKSLVVTEVQREEKDLQTEVSTICKQAHDLVAKREAEMRKIIQEKTKKKMETVQAQLAAEKLDLQNNQQQKAYLEQLQEAQSTLDMYTVLHTEQTETSPSGNSAEDVPRDLLLKSDMDAFKSAVEKMLRLEMKTSFPFDPNSTLVMHSTIDSYRATDLIVLKINGVDVCVVTFHGKNHIKAYWIEGTRKESILNLDNYAWGITHLKDNRVAVTIPDGNMISLLDIGTSISEIKSIKTENKYFGLASVNENMFAAGSSRSECIDLIDHSGIILKTLSDKCIKYPNFILVHTKSSLLVSDWGSKSVYSMGLDGKIKFCYSPKETERQLRQNRGVVMTAEKHIIVAVYKEKKVVLLTEDGHFVKDVLTAADGLDKPFGLCLHENKIIITQKTKPIKVFEYLKTCFLCNAKGTSVPSKFWCHICDIAMCDICHQTHSLIPTSRDHEVSQISQDFKVTRKRKVYCQEHPKNEIELCCKICDKPICQMCCILYHRKCDEVVTMESLKPEIQTKLNQMVEEISQKIDKMSNNVNQKSLMITEVQKEEDDLQMEVSEICKQARDLIAKKEAEMKKIIQGKMKEKMGIVQSQLAAEKLDLQNNQQRKAYLEQLQEQQTTLDMYTVLHTGQAESSPPGNSAADVPRDLLLKSDMDAFKSAVEKMLCLEVKFPEFDPNSTLVLHSTIDSNNAIDLAVLEINGADVCVVTFHDKNHIKAFWVEDTRRESILDLDNFAWGITHLKETQVAISIPNEKTISLLHIGTNISEIKSIKTKKMYCGLASVDDIRFAASSVNYIDLIDHNGIILKTISDKCIKFPNFMLLCDVSSLLVSDWGSQSVYNIGLDGKIKFCYSPKETERQLMENRGVVMTAGRHILGG